MGLRLSGLEVITVGYIEIEPYCQEIIQARIKDGLLDDAPVPRTGGHRYGGIPLPSLLPRRKAQRKSRRPQSLARDPTCHTGGGTHVGAAGERPRAGGRR